MGELNEVKLYVRENEIRLIFDWDFKVVKLDDNPNLSVKIRVRLICEVQITLIKCLRFETPFFHLPSWDALGLIVAYHQLNVDPNPDMYPNKEKDNLQRKARLPLARLNEC